MSLGGGTRMNAQTVLHQTLKAQYRKTKQDTDLKQNWYYCAYFCAYTNVIIHDHHFYNILFYDAKLPNFPKFQKYEKVEILPKFGFKYFLYSG